MMWRLQASRTAAARSLHPSFSRMLLTCVFTVFSLRKRRTAISALFLPSAISRSTSRSRRVIEGMFSAAALTSCGSRSDSPAATARMAPANSAGRVLEQVAERAGLERRKDVVLVAIGREDDDADLRVSRADLAERLDPVHHGHLDIEKDHVGMCPPSLFHRLDAV